MGIRPLPSGAFQVRFQHRHVAFIATYPTRAPAEEAEPLLRAAAHAGQHATDDRQITQEPSTRLRAQRPARSPPPDQVRATSAAAAVEVGATSTVDSRIRASDCTIMP